LFAKADSKDVIAVDFYDDCYVPARSRAINYIVARKHFFDFHTLGILNPQSEVLFVAKESACVAFVVESKAVRVVAVCQESVKSTRS
jgi:hypothetical protein